MKTFYSKQDILNRLKEVYNIQKDIDLANLLGISKSTLSNWVSRDSLDYDRVFSKCEHINIDWLLTGRGSMLRDDDSLQIKNLPAREISESPAQKNMIPFYDDVSTIGGLNDRVAATNATSPTEWIDAGDWFPEATAAIRHYGDSMVEYPSGSILALKRVNDVRLIMNGRNYVIETTEYRVTKQLQDEGDHFMAYSTNRETYPNGHQIHAPFPIPKDAILHIDLVLGCVTKEYSNGAIQIRK